MSTSQARVETVMHRLLTDEELRIRFAFDKFDTIAEILAGGVVLTSDEIDMFVRSDVRLWFDSHQQARGGVRARTTTGAFMTGGFQ